MASGALTLAFLVQAAWLSWHDDRAWHWLRLAVAVLATVAGVALTVMYAPRLWRRFRTEEGD